MPDPERKLKMNDTIMKQLLRIIPIAAAALLPLGATAQTLTPEDYCDPKLTSVPGIKDMTPMADGVSYCAISDDGSAIEVFSYKTGKKTSTLFDINTVKGEVKIQDFDGFRLSENERKILLWNSTEKIYRYSFYAQYYVYDIARGTLKKVSEGGKQRGAILSHDGRMVAYQRDNNIFISNLDYDTDRAITTDGKRNEIIYGTPDWGYEEEFGVQNTMHFSADDNTLVFMRFDEKDVPVYSFDDYKDYCDEDPLSDPYPESYEYKYSLPGYQNSVVSLLSYEINNRVTKTMDLPVGEKDYIPSVDFAGDGKTVMAMVLNRDQNKLQLFAVNPASTVAKLIYTDTSEAWLSPSAYQMLDYGKTTFLIGSERSGFRHLYEYDYNGTLKRQVTKGDFNVTNLYGRDPKGTVYVQTTQRGPQNRNVAKVDARGNITMLNPEDGTENAWFSKTFEYYVRNYSNVSTPNRYTLHATSGNRKIADINLNAEYAAKYARLPKAEFLTVKNADGLEMNAYMIKPADFDPSKKYPLVMWQYNGPDSQEVLNRWKLDGLYYIVSQGYVVACVDGRGTGNRTRGWANAVYRELGKYETQDQLAAARHFASLPFIDADRMACFGWSYGGYMTLMELSDPANPFKAGISMAPVTDWRFYDSIYTERYMLTPQQNEGGYETASALNRTKDMKRHLLIMSGTSDDNVHYYNTLKYTSKLNAEGTLFDMMSFTGFEHSLRMCNARTMLYRKVVDFLKLRL